MDRLFKSFGYALHGLKLCFVSERNFRIHTASAVTVIVFAFVFNISSFEWIVIIFCIAFTIAMEILNTAIEKLCDFVYKDDHPAIKKVKDISAGAVLVSAIFSLVAGLIIFFPKIIIFFKSI